MLRISQRQEPLFVLFLLSALIIGFNYPDIFSAKTMYVDDNHRYILGLENKIHELIFQRNSLRALVIFPLYKLLSINLIYARLAQTLFFYIPLALSIYGLLRYYTKMPAWLAFCSSILPCILPGQTQIPSFIDGSYTVQGLLVFILTMHVFYLFLKKNSFSWQYLIASIVLYGASLEMMDHSIFLAPFAIISFFGIVSWKDNRKKIIFLSLTVLILALVKSILIISFPTVPASVPIEPTVSLLLSRLSLLAGDTLPFAFSLSGKPFGSTGLWLVFFVISGAAVVKAEKNEKILIAYGFLWLACSSIVFLTISRSYSPRLAHIPGFGVNLILVLSIYVLTRNYRIVYKHDITILLIFIILLFSGFSRLQVMHNFFNSPNKFHTIFTATLKQFNFPTNSQIVVLDGNVSTGGWWNYSTGYMKYATKRKDITGLIGPEFKHYDPFNPDSKGYQKEDKMNGLSLKDPIFIFKFQRDPEYSLEQREFALQYMNESWTVYKLNKINGSVQKVANGAGVDNFHNFLQGNNITMNDVAFSQGIEH